ncbi:MAG: hypothetical protein QNK03_15755 [Myxococcota bacterium]|nr:hypothetical protein [Myxococcota bacterium]
MSQSSRRGRDPTSRTSDRQHFDADFARYLPRVHAYVARRVRYRADVQVLVEEILGEAFRHAGARSEARAARDRRVFQLTCESLARYRRAHPPRPRPPRQQHPPRGSSP